MKRGDLGYWSWRAKVGRPKNIPTPQLLWEYACKYFEMIDESPFLKQDFIRGGDSAGKIVELETMLPYTWAGLEDYLAENDILAKLEDYKANKDNRYSEFAEVITHIDKIIYDRKYSGAAVNAFNANIIARDLGLADKTQNTITVEQPLFPDAD